MRRLARVKGICGLATLLLALAATGDDLNGAPDWPTNELHFTRMYSWEHADDPFYPEAMTGLAYRFAVNYVIYAMTH